MKTAILFLLFLLSGCKIQHFVLKSKDINKLPTSITPDSVVFLPPAFSMHSLDDKFRLQHPITSFGKPDILTEIYYRKLDSLNLKHDAAINTTCITNKMHSENWRDSVWYTLVPYQCIPFVKGKYNVLLYNRMDIHNGVTYSAGPSSGSYMQSMLIVIKDGSILYTRRFYSLVGIREKQIEMSINDSARTPYFPNYQIELVLSKVTDKLFKQIK
jgi:hypothetical protein